MKRIRKLSSVALARCILNEIWKIQDAGGVSHGRSFENVLLEAALALMPRRSTTVYSRDVLLAEAARRTRISENRRLQEHFKKLNELTRK